MTEPTTDRTAGRSSRAKRRHPAQGARIAAAGLGLASMFGLVGAMGLARHPSAGASTVVSPAPAPVAPQVIVVIHRDGTVQPAPAASPAAGQVVAATQGPVVLTARPTVVPVSASAQGPAAATHGSR